MTLPRFHTPLSELAEDAPGTELSLPADVARHVQVRRMQPGAPLILFSDASYEWHCRILRMERSAVLVRLESKTTVQRELPMAVTLAVGMPANDRMDSLIEKATELGARTVQPLTTARSVLRLEGARADKRVAHWAAVAISSTEQSGRTRPMHVDAIKDLATWLQDPAASQQADSGASLRFVLSTGDAPSLSATLRDHLRPAVRPIVFLSGPEGGLTAEEEALAVARGFVRVSLGPRTLRADTAPLAALALTAAHYES